MKCLMVAVFTETSTNNAQARGFDNNGCEVIRYDYRQRAKDLGKAERDRELIGICKVQKPNFVFFSKCNGMDISVIHECNTVSKTVLWYMDPKNKNFNEELIDKIRYCSYTFCALQVPYKEAKKYSWSTYFLNEGFDTEVDKPYNLPYKYDVTFIGSLYGDRKSYFDSININHFNSAYKEQHAKIVSQSKINLNFTEGGTSDRTYKVLAAKGFLLTQPWEDMDYDFEVGKDLDIFRNEKELQIKTAYYLENKDAREKIAEHGCKTVQKFTREAWAKKIIGVIK